MKPTINIKTPAINDRTLIDMNSSTVKDELTKDNLFCNSFF